MNTSKKYFCYEIFKNLSIWSKNRKLKYGPCSFYKGDTGTSDNFNLSGIWNGPEHTKIKLLIDQDLPVPGCATCYQSEHHGLVSRRMGAKNSYENFFQDTNIELSGPQSIDYSVGSLCNLKCLICGPANSSSWITDYQKLYPDVDTILFKHDKFNQIEITDETLLQNVKNIHFHGGGEPLLSDNHVKLLKAVKNIRGLSDVRVYYNTNGTRRASQEILDLWAECRLVELYFSIDDIGARFDYQRSGANWQAVQENLEWFKINMPVNHMFKINCVWSYLNFFYLNELVDWHVNNFSQNRLGDPVALIFQKGMDSVFALSLDAVSQKLKSNLIEKFHQYPELLALVHTLREDDEENHQKFWAEIEKINAIRKNRFQDLCPEVSNLLNFIN
jgi:organic radical activating enzyme